MEVSCLGQRWLQHSLGSGGNSGRLYWTIVDSLGIVFDHISSFLPLALGSYDPKDDCCIPRPVAGNGGRPPASHDSWPGFRSPCDPLQHHRHPPLPSPRWYSSCSLRCTHHNHYQCQPPLNPIASQLIVFALMYPFVPLYTPKHILTYFLYYRAKNYPY